MALPSSGTITIGDLRTEFGGPTPSDLSDYYANGSYVPSGTAGSGGAVPSSGTISLSDFYGVPIQYFKDLFNETSNTSITSHTPDYDWYGGGWSGTGTVNATEDAFENGAAYVEAPYDFKAELTIYVQVTGVGDGNGLVFNYVDSNSYWTARASQGYGVTSFMLQEFASGYPTTRVSATGNINTVDSDTYGAHGFRVEANDDTVTARWWNSAFSAARCDEISWTPPSGSRAYKTEETMKINAGADSEYIYYLEVWPTSHTW